jgi:hypothetical protein
LAQLAVSWALFGLIWMVQLVHYPSFRYVPDFTEFHPHHTGSIGLLVGPLMVAELALATWFVFRSGFVWVWIGPLLLVGAIWLLTFLWAVPLHNSLANHRDPRTIESLIQANWPRTVLWTIKAVWVSLLFLLRAPAG